LSGHDKINENQLCYTMIRDNVNYDV